LTLTQARTEQITLSLTALPSASLVALGADHLNAAHLNADINDHLRAHVEATAFLEKQILPVSQQSGVNPADIRSEQQASSYMLGVQSKLRAQMNEAPAADSGTGT